MKLIFSIAIIIFNLDIQAQNLKDDPVQNFEKLWSEFNLRYANFKLKSVNWQNIYSQYRPQITESTTSNELFDVSCHMLQQLSDGHVNLSGLTNLGVRRCSAPYSYEIIDEFGSLEKIIPLIKNTLVNQNFSALSNINGMGLIRCAVSEDYGYLIINQFDGFAIGEVKKSMRKALEQFEDKKGVIVDVRLNGGGYDKIAYKIAGRFVDKKRLGHYKKTRIKGTQDFTSRQSWYLKPKGKIQFTKPIIILTSDWSASATEVFALAMRELPYVTIVGNQTEGIFSDMFEFKLPNGWKASLSHQKYFSSKMVNYEGKGIEPDFKILNYKIDTSDHVLLKAIEILDNN